MFPEEFARLVKQKVLAQAKGNAYVRKQLLLLGVCNAFLWRSFCLEAFASFYAYGPLSHKWALENKQIYQNCWFGNIFLRRSFFIHWYQLLLPHIVGSTCRSGFLRGHPVCVGPNPNLFQNSSLLQTPHTYPSDASTVRSTSGSPLLELKEGARHNWSMSSGF